MPFNTYIYILIFLPLTIIGYYLICKYNNKAGKIFLIIASMLFYIYAGIIGFCWLLLSITVNYLLIKILMKEKKKNILFFAVAINIGLLFYFKYTNFVILTINNFLDKDINSLNIILPIGISFFTFQQISYLVDTYNDKTSANSLSDYLFYITFFPKIMMGPIVKQDYLISQLNDENNKKISYENLVDGIKMFVIGLFKKVILADTFSNVVSWAFALSDFSALTSIDTILIMLAYTFQIYFDFSGYSDMAIASAKMLNINLPINFDSPYKATSIRDFWKRWHISLSKFFTEYLYIPLGGNKKGKLKTILNTLIVFLFSGLWHGANWNFILWGLLNGLLSIFDRITERYRKNIHKLIQWLFTFFLINILWVLFRANSISQWLTIISQMFNFNNLVISEELIHRFIYIKDFPQIKIFLMLMFYLIGFILCLCFENSYKMKHKNNIYTVFYYAFIFIVAFISLGSEAIFVYFDF
ncbi:MAG: MBOAT family O-acyltransferase [Erysipelotrichaceae bacterium]